MNLLSPPPWTRYDTRSIFKLYLTFEFIVFLLLYWLSYVGNDKCEGIWKKKKKKENFNLQKLPEVPDRKSGWRMRKEKRHPLDKGELAILSLSGSDQRFDNTVAFWCLGTTHTSLDVALVSPFHPVAALSLGEHYAEIYKTHKWTIN